MKALLLDTRNDKHYVGDTYVELAAETGRVTINLADRTVFIDGKKALEYSSEFTYDEFIKDGAKGAVRQLVKDYGFVLFRNEDRS